jgi:hypothetical protein
MSGTDMVEIVVYDAPTGRRGVCDCGCGHHHGHDHASEAGQGDHHHNHQPDPFEKINLEMQTRAMALTLEKEFPGRVRVEYINVLQDPRGAQLPQTELLNSQTYPPPLVYLNGKGRFAGALPVERIREEIQTILAERDA